VRQGSRAQFTSGTAARGSDKKILCAKRAGMSRVSDVNGRVGHRVPEKSDVSVIV
jgi:hypothetical protein